MSFDRKSLKKHLLKYIDELMDDNKIRAIVAEHKSAIDDGHEYVNTKGYDQYDPKNKKRIEVKYTDYIKPGKELRVNSLYGKMGKCDQVKFIDAVNGRTFLVPADVLFKFGEFSGKEFLWSSSYNTRDKVRVSNTQLLLQYEVAHA